MKLRAALLRLFQRTRPGPAPQPRPAPPATPPARRAPLLPPVDAVETQFEAARRFHNRTR